MSMETLSLTRISLLEISLLWIPVELLQVAASCKLSALSCLAAVDLGMDRPHLLAGFYFVI